KNVERASVAPNAAISGLSCALLERGQQQGHACDVFDLAVEDAGRSLDALTREPEALVESDRRLVGGIDLELDSADALQFGLAEKRTEKGRAQPPPSVRLQHTHAEYCGVAKALDRLPGDIAPADHLGPCQCDELNDASRGQGAQEGAHFVERGRLNHRDMPTLARNGAEAAPDGVGVCRDAGSDGDVGV